MIASVIRENEETKNVPISMQKFGFALTGFIIAQLIVVGSIAATLKGDVISFRSTEVQVAARRL